MEKIKCDNLTESAIRNFLYQLATGEKQNETRLRTCTAHTFDVYEGNTIRYKVLVSYSTIVAYFDYDSGTFFDVLRVVYGYTATSAQHIAKFKKELSPLISRDIRYM